MSQGSLKLRPDTPVSICFGIHDARGRLEQIRHDGEWVVDTWRELRGHIVFRSRFRKCQMGGKHTLENEGKKEASITAPLCDWVGNCPYRM